MAGHISKIPSLCSPLSSHIAMHYLVVLRTQTRAFCRSFNSIRSLNMKEINYSVLSFSGLNENSLLSSCLQWPYILIRNDKFGAEYGE